MRVEMGGGEYRGDHNDGKAKEASAVIDFQCDPVRSGLEGLSTEEDGDDDEARRRRREEGENRGRSLQFKSFDHTEEDTYVLRLDWKTRYACDEYQRGKLNNSSHWGFFTWLIVM